MANVEYEGNSYDGFEGYVGFALETGMLGSTATELPASPTLAPIGFASSPEIDTPESLSDVMGVGRKNAFGFKGKRREPYAKGSLLLSHAANCKKLLQASSSNTPTSAIAAVNRHAGMPVVTLGGGVANPDDVARRILWQVRYGMLSSLSLMIAMNELVRLEYEIRALTAVKASSVTPFTDSAIVTAGGTPFTMDECWMEYDDDTNTIDLSGIAENIRLTIANQINLRGIRHPHPELKDAHPLTRAPRQLTAGKETTGIELGLTDEVPTVPGTLNFRLNNGIGQVNCSLTGIALANNTMNAADAESPFTFATTFRSTSMIFS